MRSYLLDHRILKDVLTKNPVKPAVKRKLIAGILERYQISERQACQVLGNEAVASCFRD
jgi:hypothetical protein